MSEDAQVAEYLKQKPDVEVYFNGETGKWQWAVCVHKTDFWLDAFDTKIEADAFCTKHGLSVVAEWSEWDSAIYES